MKFYVVIPARFSSTRLPGKPLRDIAGKPMIQRVYEQASQSAAEKVIVATDDGRIADAVEAFGGEWCMTSPDHPSGTDRLQQVAQLCGFDDEAVVVNVQGDEPLIPPGVIDQVADNMIDNPQAGVATLVEPILSDDDFTNPNVVKAVADSRGMALYFSRAPIPWPRDLMAGSAASKTGVVSEMNAIRPMRHIGIYAYRVAQLNRFVDWPVAPLEALECLEQLRFLYHGVAIHIAEAVADVPGGVDTEEDLQRVTEQILAEARNG
jgi:3-deoxy-manno-octulosonate cytidylyltransferase (CMP-KDO synthetase)